MYQPFAYMAAAGGGGGGFDPTLGGAISPYFWYDFTDSSTMTLSGTDVTTIASKGSNTGTLAPGTTGTKYTSAYVAPTFNTTHTTFNGNGTSTNSVMARRYGSGTYNTDGNFGADTSNTTICWSSFIGIRCYLDVLYCKRKRGLGIMLVIFLYNLSNSCRHSCMYCK